jgi:glyoxylase-like metal-dependent hydrolase (beta-lactamase superfamily II)
MLSPRLRKLTDRVWLFEPDSTRTEPSVGIITTPTQTVLVDAGNSPNHARAVRASLQSIQAPPVRYVIYTHHHWDHVFGAAVWDAPVVAHERCRQHILAYTPEPWSAEYLTEASRQTPGLAHRYRAIGAAIQDWNAFKIVVPSIVFDARKFTLPLDGLTVELEHIGGGHADDSTVVRVLEDRVLFMADCFYPPPLHLRTPDSMEDEQMLMGFFAEKLDCYVDGHTGLLAP